MDEVLTIDLNTHVHVHMYAEISFILHVFLNTHVQTIIYTNRLIKSCTNTKVQTHNVFDFYNTHTQTNIQIQP